MTAPVSPSPPDPAQTVLASLIERLRPALHRYCARMMGASVEGEDVVQDALLKAAEAWSEAGPGENPDGWLFRIAHNAALDALRRRSRRAAFEGEGHIDMAPQQRTDFDPLGARASLQILARLPVAQRSAVTLRDVLDFSVEEIGQMLDLSLPAVKGLLQRGRQRLAGIAGEPAELRAPPLSKVERERLEIYVARFNAHDFDAVRAMLAEDVRLDLVNRLQLRGRDKVAPYFGRYDVATHWRCAVGTVDGRPAVLMLDAQDAGGRPLYFVTLEWRGGEIVAIRDFLFARYVLESAEIATSEG
ncbi:sigma-70 family RNA polymerase sigma factor [Bosea sp. LjRoot90]|uniref:sigma-70 family RNA polymerase sigma factor n=1 Tax=Bosea sp. LjRoot90 TaxID=3342342 RepID=UPI003ECF3F21